MSTAFSAAEGCPLCGQPVSEEFLSLDPAVDPLTLLQLKKTNPGWNTSRPACPDCVHRAAQAARLTLSQTSLQDDLLLPYPVYSLEEPRLLPTPYRIGASPQYSGQGVTLAFIDSGFYPHPDLTRPRSRILAYVDATFEHPVQRDDFSQLHVSSWHGLMTSCIAAGNGYKSAGLYAGAASQSKLVLVKAGNEYKPGIREVDIERALSWVIDNHKRFNIRIINISLGGDYPPRRGILSNLDHLVEKASALGLVVVTAAGNSGIERLLPPATAPSAITVGGLDDRNSLNPAIWQMYPSNYGVSPYAHPKPELIAPAVWLAAPMLPRTSVHREGVRLWRLNQIIESSYKLLDSGGIHSFVRRSPSIKRLEEKYRQVRRRMIEQKYIHPHYQHVDGTSMAAPVVTSIIAQMLEANPSLSPSQVKQVLTSTAVRLPSFPSERQGAGLIQPASAIALARRLPGGPLHDLPSSPHTQPGQIHFYYYDPSHQVQQVSLVGSFNGWDPQRHILQSPSPGFWQIAIPSLTPGIYRYKFSLDGIWQNDPENPSRVEDGYGGFSSLLEYTA